MSLNVVSLQGRLTTDPELRKTEGGVARVFFYLAVDRDYKTQGGAYETDFIPCNAWRQQAEFICRNFVKGQLVNLVGRLEFRNWKDREGNSRESGQVQVEHIYFCGGRKAASASDAPEPLGMTEIPEGEEGELPF